MTEMKALDAARAAQDGNAEAAAASGIVYPPVFGSVDAERQLHIHIR